MRFIYSIFKQHGLLIIRPETAEFKRMLKDYIIGDLLDGVTSKIVSETNTQLTQKGFSSQLKLQDTNFFFIKDGIREKILRDENHMFSFSTLTKVFDKNEILKMVNSKQVKYFSPNVIYRALFQETILPNIAFIGGSGEISYWLQLKQLFDYYNINFPILMVRNSFFFLPFSLINNLKKYDVDISKLMTQDKLRAEINLQKNISNILGKEIDELNLVLDNIIDKVKKSNLQKLQLALSYSQATKQKFHNLNDKLIKDNRYYENKRYHLLKQTLEVMYPRNILQERIENILPFYSMFGNNIIDDIIAYSNNIVPETKIVGY